MEVSKMEKCPEDDFPCSICYPTPVDMPNYIVALTSSDGVLFALGIETAYQVWQRALMAWYDQNTDPVMISPVTDPTAPSIHGRLNWSIPLCI
jgi:hypothetical protein